MSEGIDTSRDGVREEGRGSGRDVPRKVEEEGARGVEEGGRRGLRNTYEGEACQPLVCLCGAQEALGEASGGGCPHAVLQALEHSLLHGKNLGDVCVCVCVCVHIYVCASECCVCVCGRPHAALEALEHGLLYC